MFDALTPRSRGAMIALDEHKVFVPSVLRDISAFGQWGGAPGKLLAQQLISP